MKHNKKCVLLALMLFAVLSFCLLVPAYAMPSVRDGIVTDRDGIIEGDSDVTLPKVTLPDQNGTMTPNEQGTDNGGSAVMPGLTGGADTSDRTPSSENPATDRTTTSAVTTRSPSTTQIPSTSSPADDMQNDADGNGMAVWGVILAIIIIAAIAVILYMLFAKRR